MVTRFSIFESRRSQFYTDAEIKQFQSLCRRLKYNINKYLGGDFVSVSWCDNKDTPIYLSRTSLIFTNNGNYECDEEKLSILRKAILKTGGNFRYILLTKSQAEQLLSDAKIKFYNIEVDEMTKKYNL